MKRIVLLFLLSFCFFDLAAQDQDKSTANSSQIEDILTSLSSLSSDQGILIVVNNTTIGTIQNINKDLKTIFDIRAIDSIQVIDATEKFNRPIDKGKKKVVRYILKKTATISEPIDKKSGLYNEKSLNTSKEWQEYLPRWIDPLTPSENEAPIGRYTAVVRYCVDPSGNISNILPMTSHGYGMEEQIIKGIMRYPNKEPVILDGKAVKTYKTQPVTFTVTSDSKKFTNKEITESDNSPIKLSTNKLKLGQQNLLEITVDGVSDSDLESEISKGTIVRMSIGRYRVKVDETGPVQLSIWKVKKKKRELVGIAELLVNE